MSAFLGILAASYAYTLGRLSLTGGLSLLAMVFIIYLFYRNSKPLFLKIILGLLVLGGTTLFYLHKVPGFQNWLIFSQYKISPDSAPYNMYLNIDKTLIGLALLLFGQKFLSFKGWRDCLSTALPVGILLSFILILIALLLNYVRFDPKIPSIFWIWAPTNLLFVCMAEEAFFRGFIQTQLQRLFKRIAGGQWFALFIASFIFGLAHYPGGPYFIALAAFAGLGYGYAYLRSGRIEAPILVHFLVNTFHILGFSYPSLQ